MPAILPHEGRVIGTTRAGLKVARWTMRFDRPKQVATPSLGPGNAWRVAGECGIMGVEGYERSIEGPRLSVGLTFRRGNRIFICPLATEAESPTGERSDAGSVSYVG